MTFYTEINPPSLRSVERGLLNQLSYQSDYREVIYRNTAASTLWPLDSVYQSAVRFITDDGYNIHHCVLYDKVGWPSLTERRNNHWYLYIYKTLTGKLPSYITSLLHWNSGPLLTCSSDCLALQVLRVRTELGKKLLVLVQKTHGNSYNVT